MCTVQSPLVQTGRRTLSHDSNKWCALMAFQEQKRCKKHPMDRLVVGAWYFKLAFITHLMLNWRITWSEANFVHGALLVGYYSQLIALTDMVMSASLSYILYCSIVYCTQLRSSLVK